jgi:enoyl-CoA hydratase/carnithine racemase
MLRSRKRQSTEVEMAAYPHFEHLLLAQLDGILTVTLNRPERLNAWNRAMIGELQRLAEHLDDDPEVRVLVITGAGRAFSAGEDVGGMQALAEAPTRGFRALARKVHHFFDTLEALELPVIAALNGVAAGGGLELALSCDLRIASDAARLGLPENNVGLIPGSGGISRLVKLVGLARAKEIVLLGEMLPAAEALANGLVHRVVPADQLTAEVQTLAERLAGKAPLALGMAKLLLNRAANADWTVLRDLERLGQSVLLPTRDHLEGVEAFRQKRPARWEGR